MKLSQVFEIHEAEAQIPYGKSQEIPKQTASSADEAINLFRERINQQRGVNIPEHPKAIGKGTRGTVYTIDASLVIKITEDYSEAQASLKLIEHPLDCAVKIYDVFQLGSTKFYGIIQEHLKPLPSTLEVVINQAVKQLELSNTLIANNFDIDKIVEDIKDEIAGLRSAGDRKEPARLEKYLKTLESVGIIDIARELKKAGISYYDYHGGNLMLRGDQVVIIDLGRSKIAGAKKPEVVEKQLNIESIAKNLGAKHLSKVNNLAEAMWLYQRRQKLLRDR